MNDVLIVAENVSKTFGTKGYFGKEENHTVLHEVNIEIRKNETLALVGESGCGKTTLGRIILGVESVTAGNIFYKGEKLLPQKKINRSIRKNIQMVFQDPYSSLDPKMKIEDILMEPLFACKMCKNKKEGRAVAQKLLETVGLSAEHLKRYPHQFSGGQRQRIGIARALAVDPEFIICDEPVSALDVSVQAQILNLLKDIQHRRNLSMLFISHDLGVVRYISDRVVIMYLGYICEVGNVEDIYQSPKHPYTEYLLQAVPKMRVMQESDEQKKEEASEIGTSDVHLGCPFYERCKYRGELCLDKKPEKQTDGEREFYCHYPISVEKR